MDKNMMDNRKKMELFFPVVFGKKYRNCSISSSRSQYFKISMILLVAAVCIILCCGCSPSFSIAVARDGDVSYSFSTSAAGAVAEIVRSFSGSGEDAPLFDEVQVTDALTAAGLADISVELPDTVSISVSGKTQAGTDDGSRDVLPVVPGMLTFYSVGGGTELRLSLSPEIYSSVLELLPRETADYADLLSAPVFTGESLSGDEYSGLIGAIYGARVAQALSGSMVTVSITVPSVIRSASVSIASGTVRRKEFTVVFSVPLIDLLTQLEKIEFRIRY